MQKITKETVKTLKTKNVYSWLKDGGADTDFYVSDKFTSLVFDAGTPTVGTELKDLTLVPGANNAYVKTIANGYAYNGEDTSFLAPKSLTVIGVDAGTVYGGAFVTAGAKSTAVNKKITEETDIVEVAGGANLTISSAKISTVYGGGAGYGSVLDGNVNISLLGTNTIGKVYGGGQTGAKVDGDVQITVGSADGVKEYDIDWYGNSYSKGKIGAIYGGGYNATVDGDVTITIDSNPGYSIGTVSGSGTGKVSRVTGTRTLEIVDYSGNFATTIKDFDTIVFSGASAVTITKAQDKSIKGATYEFVVDASSVGQNAAMLTWNKKLDVKNIVVTIDAEFEKTVSGGFETTIFTSSQFTAGVEKGVKLVDSDGNFIDGGFTVEFVADTDAKGKAKKKGGSIVLKYAGADTTLDADTTGTVTLSGTNDSVAITGGLVRASVDTAGGDDRVSIQTGTQMAGDIALGTGNNVVNVQSDAELTGQIIVEKDSTNTVYVSGTIDGNAFQGGTDTTNNVVYLNSPAAIGYYKNEQLKDEEGTRDSLNNHQKFVSQVLNFSGESNDTVFVSKTSAGAIDGIDFAKGNDTLVANADINFSVTYQDGDNVFVANENDITVDDNQLKLAGSNNVFVVSNGVRANINASAIGAFMTKYDGIYLGQNAMALVNGRAVISSFSGNIDLGVTGVTDGLDIMAVQPLTDELAERIGEWYKPGDGVNANIVATNNDITVNAGAKVNGKIVDAKLVEFKGTAGGENLFFENTQIKVAKDAVVTVGSIEGLVVEDDTTTISAADAFEADAAKLTLGNDAQVVEIVNDRTIVQNITKEATFSGKVAFIGTVSAPITLKDATAFAGKTAFFNKKDITFEGANTIDVNGDNLHVNNKKLVFTDGATVAFNVLDDAKLTLDGIVNGGTYADGITAVNLGTNAGFAYGDTLRTGDWDKTLTSAFLGREKNLEINAGSKLEDTIDLSGDAEGRNVVINDGVEVTAIDTYSKPTAITLGTGADTLTIGKATIDGKIVTIDDAKDVITLNATTVNTTDGQKEAIELDGNDELAAKNAYVGGDLTGGKLVKLDTTTVTGKVTGTVEALASKIGEVADGTTTVLGANAEGVAVDGITEIGKFSNGEVVVDGAVASIGSIGAKDDGKTTYLALQNGGQVKGETIKTLSSNSTIDVYDDTAAQAIVQTSAKNAEVDLNDMASVASVTQRASDFALVNNNGVATSVGDIDQSADSAYVGDKLRTEKASFGAITQDAKTVAEVYAGANFSQEYNRKNDDFSEALEDIKIDKIERTVGTVTQKSEGNSPINWEGNYADFCVCLYANGSYENTNTYHKRAVIDVGSVAVKAGDVNQTGKNNDVYANFDYTAIGESDVKVGKTDFELGSIKQLSDEGVGNAVSVSTYSEVDAQSVLETGAVNGKVGAISQKAYKGANDVYIGTVERNTEGVTAGNAKIEVAGDISMLAYGDGATNNLKLEGNVTVTGGVNVGGVFDDGHIGEESTWGDRTAAKNTVNVAADTVTIENSLTLVGLENDLKLTNDSYVMGESIAKEVATDIALAGKTNTVDVGAGVKMDNISLYDLKDYDKIGKEGYDLTDGDYTNNVKLRGEIASLVLKHKNSKDTIKVLGGKIDGDVVTSNGNDTVVLGTDDESVTKGVMGDSTIGGNVIMGTKGSAQGMNVVKLQTSEIKGKVVNATIGGNVEMYSDSAPIVGGYNNALSLNDDKGAGAATIGGNVVMDAEVAFEAGKALKQGTNKLAMGRESKIGGDVTMNAFENNIVSFRGAGEEEVKGASNTGYAEIGGKLTMAADQNTIELKGDGKNDAKGNSAFVNGIEMQNTYADAKGDSTLTSADATNTIKVGYVWENGGKYQQIGSQLIVGKSVSELADVAMGNALVTKKGHEYALSAVEIAERGNDVLIYKKESDEDVTNITKKNTIDVVGRFSAKDVTMTAATNAITVFGDGDLEKGDKASDEVRTALFQAASITQDATENNFIVAVPTNVVSHKDENGDETAQLQSVEFVAGNITQLQYTADEDTATNNVVALGTLNVGQALNYYPGGQEFVEKKLPEALKFLVADSNSSIIVNTGDIEQLGNGYNVASIGSWVDNTYDRLGAPQSNVGAIKQGSAEVVAKDNITVLGTANAKGVSQYAENVNLLIAQAYYDGNLEWENNVPVVDGDPLYVAGTIDGDVTQVSTKKMKGDEIIEQVESVKKAFATGTTEEKIEACVNAVSAVGLNTILSLGYDVNGDVSQKGDANISIYAGGLGVMLDDENGRIRNISVGLKEVAYEMDNGETGVKQENVDVKIGGDFSQDGRANVSIFGNTEVTGTVKQTADLANVLVAYNQSSDAAANTGKGDKCEYDDYDHRNVTIEKQGDFNTQSLGDVVQKTVAVDPEDDDYIKYGDEGITDSLKVKDVLGSNAFAAANTNVKSITQENVTGANAAVVVNNVTLKSVEQMRSSPLTSAAVGMLEEYVGEVDTDLSDVTKVKDYRALNRVEVGDTKQTGAVNAEFFQGVKAGSVTQTQNVVGDNAIGKAVAEAAQKWYVYNGNSLVVKGAYNNYHGPNNGVDVTKTVANEMYWEDDQEKTRLKAIGENQRITNEVGAIAQATNVTGTYDVKDMVINSVYIENGSVTGDVSQKATAEKDANVGNKFQMQTATQQFKDVATDPETKETSEVDYFRTTVTELAGDVTQVGLANWMSLKNVTMTDPDSVITQTTNFITQYNTHGVVTEQRIGAEMNRGYRGTLKADTENVSNLLTVDGSIDFAQDDAEKMGLEAKYNIVNVGSVKQTANDNGDAKYVEKLYSANEISTRLANLGNVEQTITYGWNNIWMQSAAIDENSTEAALTAGNIKQTGLYNKIDARTVKMGMVEQTAISQEAVLTADMKQLRGPKYSANYFEIKGSVLTDPITEGQGTADDPLVIVQQPTATYASAASVVQNTVQVADEDGRFDTASYLERKEGDTENKITARYADIGGIKQRGTGIVRNFVDFTGNVRDEYEVVVEEEDITTTDAKALASCDEVKEVPAYKEETYKEVAKKVKSTRENTLGNVHQDKGVDNKIWANNAASVGDIEQIAASVETIDTKINEQENTKTVTTGMWETVSNDVNVRASDKLGDIRQTATGATFEKVVTEYVKDGEDWKLKEVEEPETNPTVTEQVVRVNNKVLLTDVGQGGDIIQKVNGLGDNIVDVIGAGTVEAAAPVLKDEKADPSKVESYVIDPNTSYVKSEIKSVDQTIAVQDFYGEGIEVDEELNYPDQLNNQAMFNYASVGTVKQSGNSVTFNSFALTGNEVVPKIVVEVVKKGEDKKEACPIAEEEVELTPTINEAKKVDVYEPVVYDDYENKVNPDTFGQIKQSGVYNTVDIHYASFKEADVADMPYAIEQETQSFKMIYENPDHMEQVKDQDGNPLFEDDGKTPVMGYAPQRFETMYDGELDNSITLEEVLGGGSVKQTVNGEKFQESKQTGNAVAELVDKSVNGSNNIQANYSTLGNVEQVNTGVSGANMLTMYGKFTMPELNEPEGEVSPENPWTITPGEYLNSVGNVTQTANCLADELGEQISNTITLENLNAGALVQTGDGFVDNQINAVGGAVTELKIDEKTGEWDDSYSVQVKTEVKSISQTGYMNSVDLSYISVAGDITLQAKDIQKTVVEGETTSETHNFGENTITLDHVEVGAISALTDSNTTVVFGKSYAQGAADATITIKSDTTVTGGIKTGSGNDTLTLGEENTDCGSIVVSGTIDLGDEKWEITELEGDPQYLIKGGQDVLVINAYKDTKIDLTKATIKGVERIETHGYCTLDVAGLVSDDVKLDTGFTSISATTISVGKISAFPGTYTVSVTTISAQKDEKGKLTTAVDYTFKDGKSGASALTGVIGSFKDGDKIVIGDGELGENGIRDAKFNDVILTGFENVTLKKDASLSNVTWAAYKDQGAVKNINFVLDSIKDGERIYIGRCEGYSFDAATSKITFEIGGQKATFSDSSASEAVYKIGNEKYTYDMNSGYLTHGELA